MSEIYSDDNQNRPKLINENKVMHSAKRFRFSFLSTICPANGAKKKAGKNSHKPIIPKLNSSLVREYTCHSITTNCIDQPNTKAKRAKRNTLNSLNLNASYGSFFPKIYSFKSFSFN